MDFLPLGIILPLLGVPALKFSTLPELFPTPSELEPRLVGLVGDPYLVPASYPHQ